MKNVKYLSLYLIFLFVLVLSLILSCVNHEEKNNKTSDINEIKDTNSITNTNEIVNQINDANLTNDTNNQNNQNNSINEITDDAAQQVEPEEVTLYDLEDGYYTVAYNKLANKNLFDFNNSLSKDGYIYKYEDDNYTSKTGIDVSTFQQEIDWKKVKGAGIDFAILRVGFRGYGEEGKLVVDSRFEENYINATNEGIDIGIYFFSQAISKEEAKQEAEFVISLINNKDIKLPIAYDLEVIKNVDTARTNNLTAEDRTSFAMEFCNTIENAGYDSIIYGNSKTFTKLMTLEKLNEYDKWYAEYLDKPLYPYDFMIWQYSESGRVDGISTSVDLDLMIIKK